MTPQDFKARTQNFALRIIGLVEAVPRNMVGSIIAKQVLRSATSVGANYRSACRARSRTDFASKMAIAEEEADETLYWLELLIKTGMVEERRLEALLKEGTELLAIITASRKTAQRRG